MTEQTTRPLVIVMADDDPDDVLLTREALEESDVFFQFHSVADGAELLAYLRHEDAYSALAPPRPDLVLLDLNMPRVGGITALSAIKQDPALRSLPVVILTTSVADEDIARTYDLGAASYIAKPASLSGMVEMMKSLGKYWFEVVMLPKTT